MEWAEKHTDVNVSFDPVILENNCAVFVGRIEFDSQVLQVMSVSIYFTR
jgi:hypothetical protein